MCCFHHRLHITSVIHTFLFILQMSSFGMGSVAYHVKWSFGLLQRVTLVLMSPNLVSMFYTHSQRFMHCNTTFVTFVAKCTLCVTHGELCRIIVALRTSCCSYFLSDQLCIFHCLCVWSWSSFISVHVSFIDPTISLIWKISLLKNFTSLSLPKLHIA